MTVLSTRSIAPQLASHDYLIRVSAPALDRIVFDHLFTLQDDAVLADCGGAARRAGCTEWQGTCAAGVISLAWDWMELADGDVRELPAVPPRSNLRLVDAKGYDLPGAESAALWEVIRRSEWQVAVRRGIARLPSPAVFEVAGPRTAQ
jgi:hypothetical protein